MGSGVNRVQGLVCSQRHEMEGLVVDIIDDNRLAVFNTEVADEAGQLEARQVALGTVSGQRVQKVVAVAQPAVDTIRRPSEAARARRTHYLCVPNIQWLSFTIFAKPWWPVFFKGVTYSLEIYSSSW